MIDSIAAEIKGLIVEGGNNLNIGAGDKPIPGMVSVDLFYPTADLHADGRDLSMFADGTVDLIYSEHFLEHVGFFEGGDMLAEWRRVLAKTGHLVVSVPDMEIVLKGVLRFDWFDSKLWNAIMRAVYGNQTAEGQFHKWGYCTTSLQEALERAGFEVEKLYRGYPPRPTPSMTVIAK